MSRVYRVGVVGCGEVWKRHLPAFERSARIRCTRVYDPIAARAVSAAEVTGACVAGSAQEAITADDVDIAAILTPVFTHVPLVEAAAAAGKHLMLEKPLATTLPEADRIVSAIARAGVKCFHPTLRALSSDLFAQLQSWTAEDGPVGPVRAGFYHLLGRPVARSAWMTDRQSCFPPAEYDPHVLDTFLTLTGAQPQTVWAHAGRYCRDFDQDDVTNMVITFSGNRYLQIDVHWVFDPAWSSTPRATFDLVCERGAIQHNWYSANWQGRDGQGEYHSPRGSSGGDRWDHYHALIHAIETGCDVSPNEHDGRRYVRIQDAALESIRSGQRLVLAGS
jgi:predicted dehydrogenase